MRSAYIAAIAAMLAGGPAFGQVVIQTTNPDAARHEWRADRERAEARQLHREAERRAAMGDYQGAAQLQREARRDWHDARRHEHRAREESSNYVYGR